ncbi:Poly-beta-1,6-N-acetyl-D-glucosamine synthase [compost metagenome]
MSLSTLIYGLSGLIFAYFIIYHLAYLLLNILAVFRIHDMEQSKILTDLPYLHSELEPPVSLLLASHDQAADVVRATQALLQLDYGKFEVIVINDGSQDDSLQRLSAAFDLHPFPEAYRVQLKTQTVKCIYRSTRYPHLRVLDKEFGGTADALNAGINASRYPLFCSVAVDGSMQPDSLQRLVMPFLNDNRVIASVAAARSALQSASQRWPALLQIVDNLRARLFAPLGWSMLNSMLIAPAGMMLLRKEAVLAAGAYRHGARNAGMELIVRMHRVMREKQRAYRIRFIAEPICWQPVANNLAALQQASVQWQQGITDSLSKNMALMFSSHGGIPGRVAYPFLLLFEVLGPLIECLSYILLLAGLLCGLISWQACFAFLSVAIGLGILLSASGLLLEEMSFHPYPKTGDIIALVVTAIISNFGYRQLSSVWRSVALIGCWRKQRTDDLPEHIKPRQIN